MFNTNVNHTYTFLASQQPVSKLKIVIVDQNRSSGYPDFCFLRKEDFQDIFMHIENSLNKNRLIILKKKCLILHRLISKPNMLREVAFPHGVVSKMVLMDAGTILKKIHERV